MKRTVCLILCFLLLLPALAACGTTKTETGTNPDATGAATDPFVDATTAAPDTLPATAPGTTAPESTTTVPETTTTPPPTTSIYETIVIPPDQRALKFEMDSNVTAEKRARNDYYLAGPDEVSNSTPTISQLIYDRNKAARDLLGVSVEYVYWDYGWGQQSGKIKEVVQGQAADAPDLFVNMVYDLGNALLFGTFKDVWFTPDSYFDFSAMGWLSDYMESMSLTHDRAYVLASDYFLDILRVACVIPFNLDMMNAEAGKLAPYILEAGQTLAPGELLSDYFFDFVEEGNWTYGVLTDLCEAIWQDVGTMQGQDDFADVLGFCGDTASKMASAMYLYSCGLDFFTEQTDEQTGRLEVKYLPDSSVLGGVFDAVSTLYAGKGTVVTAGGNKSTSPDNPGIANHKQKFNEGTILFVGGNLLGSLEDDEYQTMTQMYSVVPLPKLNVTDNYVSLIHNDADAGAINVNSTKFTALSAYLEYCTENSAELRDEFLEVVTKYKTTRYNQGTDRMLSLIYDAITSARGKMIEDAVSGAGSSGSLRWHAMLDAGSFGTTSADLAEKYQSAVATKQAKLDEIVATWYTLPKVESAE